MFLGIAHMTNFSYKLCSPPRFAPNKKRLTTILRKHLSSSESFTSVRPYSKKTSAWEIPQTSFPSENQDLHINWQMIWSRSGPSPWSKLIQHLFVS